MQDIFEESHGIFQKAKDANGLTREERLNQPPPTDYRPVIVSDAYFLSTIQTDLSHPNRFSQTHLLYSLTFLYMKRQYKQLLDIAMPMLETSSKVNLEVLEICVRAWVRLGDSGRVKTMLPPLQARNEPNYLVFLAKVSVMNQEFQEAYTALRKYCGIRSEDSWAWFELGVLFKNRLAHPEDAFMRGCGREAAVCAERCFEYSARLLERYIPTSQFEDRVRVRIEVIRATAREMQEYKGIQIIEEDVSIEVWEVVGWILEKTGKVDGGYVEAVESTGINE